MTKAHTLTQTLHLCSLLKRFERYQTRQYWLKNVDVKAILPRLQVKVVALQLSDPLKALLAI